MTVTSFSKDFLTDISHCLNEIAIYTNVLQMKWDQSHCLKSMAGTVGKWPYCFEEDFRQVLSAVQLTQ